MVFSKGKASKEGIWQIKDENTVVWKITNTACKIKFNSENIGVLVEPARNPPSLLKINPNLKKVCNKN